MVMPHLHSQFPLIHTSISHASYLVQVNLSLELFKNRIFVRGPSDFHLEFSVRKPKCSNGETFQNRGLTVLEDLFLELKILKVIIFPIFAFFAHKAFFRRSTF